ncbi:MAG: hypothetical protein ACI9RV_002905 [Glaciecola sp.]|jgi:hypothetical protein
MLAFFLLFNLPLSNVLESMLITIGCNRFYLTFFSVAFLLLIYYDIAQVDHLVR